MRVARSGRIEQAERPARSARPLSTRPLDPPGPPDPPGPCWQLPSSLLAFGLKLSASESVQPSMMQEPSSIFAFGLKFTASLSVQPLMTGMGVAGVAGSVQRHDGDLPSRWASCSAVPGGTRAVRVGRFALSNVPGYDVPRTTGSQAVSPLYWQLPSGWVAFASVGRVGVSASGDVRGLGAGDIGAYSATRQHRCLGVVVCGVRPRTSADFTGHTRNLDTAEQLGLSVALNGLVPDRAGTKPSGTLTSCLPLGCRVARLEVYAVPQAPIVRVWTGTAPRHKPVVGWVLGSPRSTRLRSLGHRRIPGRCMSGCSAVGASCPRVLQVSTPGVVKHAAVVIQLASGRSYPRPGVYSHTSAGAVARIVPHRVVWTVVTGAGGPVPSALLGTSVVLGGLFVTFPDIRHWWDSANRRDIFRDGLRRHVGTGCRAMGGRIHSGGTLSPWSRKRSLGYRRDRV